MVEDEEDTQSDWFLADEGTPQTLQLNESCEIGDLQRMSSRVELLSVPRGRLSLL